MPKFGLTRRQERLSPRTTGPVVRAARQFAELGFKILATRGTPAGKESELDDSYIRKNAIKHKVPYVTTHAGALAAAKGIAARRSAGGASVRYLHRYHAGIE